MNKYLPQVKRAVATFVSGALATPLLVGALGTPFITAALTAGLIAVVNLAWRTAQAWLKDHPEDAEKIAAEIAAKALEAERERQKAELAEALARLKAAAKAKVESAPVVIADQLEGE